MVRDLSLEWFSGVCGFCMKCLCSYYCLGCLGLDCEFGLGCCSVLLMNTWCGFLIGGWFRVVIDIV